MILLFRSDLKKKDITFGYEKVKKFRRKSIYNVLRIQIYIISAHIMS